MKRTPWATLGLWSSLLAGVSLAVVACTGDTTNDLIATDTLQLDLTFLQMDDSPVKGEITVEVNLDGIDLFEDDSRCPNPSDRHMSATARRTVTPDAQGNATLQLTVGDFSSLVEAGCFVSSFDPVNVADLRIEAHVLGSQDRCQRFCAKNQPATYRSCVSACNNGTTRILASHITDGDKFRSRIEGKPGARSLLFGPNVYFDRLSGQIRDVNGPDLKVDGPAIARSLRISNEVFSPASCAVVEGCLNGTGTRRLLRFDGIIQNLGDADFVLGDPETQPDLFNFSACHNHYHLREAMRYELLHKDTLQPVTLGDGTLVVGRKQGFCMVDMTQIAGSNPPKFRCYDQGLTSGWSDIYSNRLDCQWIDITGVPAGDYKVRVTVNPGHSLFEGDHSNNSTVVDYTVPLSQGAGEEVIDRTAEDNGPHVEESKPYF